MYSEQLPEQRRILGEEWSDLDAAHRRAEKLADLTLASLYGEHRGQKMGVEDAKMAAKADPRYSEACEKAIETRRQANRKLAELRGLEYAWETWRTKNATRRAEMGLR